MSSFSVVREGPYLGLPIGGSFVLPIGGSFVPPKRGIVASRLSSVNDSTQTSAGLETKRSSCIPLRERADLSMVIRWQIWLSTHALS